MVRDACAGVRGPPISKIFEIVQRDHHAEYTRAGVRGFLVGVVVNLSMTAILADTATPSYVFRP
jgi:hypothetical protein